MAGRAVARWEWSTDRAHRATCTAFVRILKIIEPITPIPLPDSEVPELPPVNEGDLLFTYNEKTRTFPTFAYKWARPLAYLPQHHIAIEDL